MYLGDLTQGCTYITPVPISEVHRVTSAKLLGVTLCDTLRFDVHIGNMLKMCSQRIYLLKLLRDQGLLRHHLNTVFDPPVLSRFRYTIPAWSGFLSVESKCQVNSFLKRAFKYVFVVDYTALRQLQTIPTETC